MKVNLVDSYLFFNYSQNKLLVMLLLILGLEELSSKFKKDIIGAKHEQSLEWMTWF